MSIYSHCQFELDTSDSIDIQSRIDGIISAGFSAMASPCEILIETEDYDLVRHVGELAQNEAHRIEAKFSRYRQDSILTKINTSSVTAGALPFWT